VEIPQIRVMMALLLQRGTDLVNKFNVILLNSLNAVNIYLLAISIVHSIFSLGNSGPIQICRQVALHVVQLLFKWDVICLPSLCAHVILLVMTI
jgi:hypothetical protein